MPLFAVVSVATAEAARAAMAGAGLAFDVLLAEVWAWNPAGRRCLRRTCAQ